MDETVLILLNGYVAKSKTFDNLVFFISANQLVKGVPIAMLFLFLWFRPRACHLQKRAQLIALLVVSFISIVVGRMAALLLPHRVRPIHSEALDLELPLSISSHTLDGWSSFPSDHAVLYATLATAFWKVDRRAGIAAVVHAFFVIAFARVYLTLHFPTDILGGAAIGLILTLILMKPVSASISRAGGLELADKWPQYFHPFLFLILFQIATMFTSARQLAKAIVGLFT
jgi:undecaprenyl-diphosphatase